jgi:hypothetical protein
VSVLRPTLITVGVVLVFGLLFIIGNRWLPDPWQLPPDSARHQAYEYFLVKHRWVTAAALLIYGLLVAAVFKRELPEALIDLGWEFWIRVVLSSVFLALALLWAP